MSFVKNNLSYSKTIVDEIEALKLLISDFSDDLSKTKTITNNCPKPDDYDENKDSDEAKAYSARDDFVGKYNTAVDAAHKVAGKLKDNAFTEKINNVKAALEQINSLITTFNSGDINLKDLNDPEKGLSVNDEGIVFVKVGDTNYRLGDLVNCFYTELGMNMNSAVSIGVLADGKSDIDVDKMIKASISSNDAFTNQLLGAGYFGVASQADIIATAGAAGVYDDMSKDVSSILAGMDFSKLSVEGMSDAELEILKQALAGKTGSNLALSGAGLPAVMLAAYGMLKPTATTEPTTEAATTPDDGGYDDYRYPSGGVDGPTEAPTTLIEVLEISTEAIPEALTIELDFDELALEQFEALGEEKINSLYNEVTNEVMTLFDDSDKSALIKKLSDYGYSQSDIDMIILDREMAINACITGERRALLTQYANGLAAQGGITDFDTAYDNELKYGIDDSSDFVYAMGDKDVAKAYETYSTAREEYFKAVSDANTSIADAETAKTELETLKAELVKSSTDDMTKWTEEQLTKYNDAVKKYNEALKTSIDGVKATEELKLKYESTRADYLEEREEYIEELQSAVDNMGSGSVPDVNYVQSGGINTGVTGPVIEGVDYSVFTADNSTQSSNTGLGTNNSTSQIITNTNTNTTNTINNSSSATVIDSTNKSNISTGVVTDTAASVEVLDLPVLNNSISSNVGTSTESTGNSTFDTPNISIKL